MITLLAESKTMASDQIAIEPQIFLDNKPCFEDMADSIENHVSNLSPNEIASILGISNALALKTHNLAFEFSHKQTGYKALYGFIGEAFRALDVKTLSQEAVKRSQDQLRFISSVYGILKAFDIIKPYRCEFNKEITSDHKTPIQLFKSKITIEIVNQIKQNKVGEIINLLPGDADKCLDWKIIRSFAKVHKVVFQKIDSGGKLKTPIAKRLKELRGLMARTILEQNIQTFQQLTQVKSDQFIFSPTDSKPLLPVFISTE